MFNKPLLSQNRTMLWHGTKTENLMGILHRGLLIDAPNAVRCASAYGNGIYLADTFEKSWSYSGSPSGKYSHNKYNPMFIVILFIIYNLGLLIPIRHCLLILGGYYNKPKKLHCKYMLLCETALGEMETRQNGRQSRYNPYTHDYSQVNTSFVKKCILLYYYIV